jgi:hypothetical protein
VATLVKVDDTRRYGLLLLATLASVALQGILPPSSGEQLLVTALSGATLVLALRAAEFPRPLIAAAVAIALAVLGVALARVTVGGIGEGTTRALNAALVAVGPPAVAVGVVRELRSSPQVRIQAVMGVLSLYVLIGMLFAFTYGAIDRFAADPFFMNGVVGTVSNCLYFSFTTLTTVGFGDLAPRSDLGHTLAVFEALIGQIYMVTVVSLIVGHLGAPGTRGREQLG